ncbi:hypothetical protein GALL_486360 [mine drainage metagenome]|uniref:Uncharacterized protein n=1 Tax=mine drainage metagenome TaxID=410659 RepID=A0A1J5PDQ1_9ZZZZ
MYGALHGFHHDAVAHDEFAILEHMAGAGEHGLAVGVVAVDHDVGGGPGGKMAAVMQAERARRRGTGHDGDLFQGVFTLQAAQLAVRSDVRVHRIEHAVSEVAIHQQPDQVGIAGEGCAVGMVGGEEDAPRIAHPQEQLKADGPLQCVDEVPVAVAERHHTAAGVTFDVHAHPAFRVGMAMVAVLRHGVARCGDRLAEHDLADIDGDVGVGIHRVGDAFGLGRKMPFAFGAVAVELDMGDVHRQPFRRLHRGQGGVGISRHAEVAGVDVEGVGHAQVVQRLRQGVQDLTRADAVMRIQLVDVEVADVEFECRNSARIDHFERHRLGVIQGPAHVVGQGLRFGAGRQQMQEKVVVAQHGVGALVHHRRVAEFQMGLARVGGQHGRFEAGGVAHFGVAVAGGPGGRRGTAAAGVQPASIVQGARRAHVKAVVFAQQGAGDVDLAAADMGVDVDGAGHHQRASEVDVLVDHGVRPGIADDAPALHMQRARRSVQLLDRIDDARIAKPQHGAAPR